MTRPRFQVGMFKIHPKVPESMSAQAKRFLMNCFEPNPDDRATAADLLGDAFLRSSPRKKAKAPQEEDLQDASAGGTARFDAVRRSATPRRVSFDPFSSHLSQGTTTAACLCRSPSWWRTPTLTRTPSTCPARWTSGAPPFERIASPRARPPVDNSCRE